ncbi:pentatricopeptide repeat-containing protein At1g74630 [Apium graveolens]|uniref:pentatricopeptide repeat-containing protein At1g74630 n=1 Tax=Apium graveolens TaxID=4045 RepID=UPI003D7AD0E7
MSREHLCISLLNLCKSLKSITQVHAFSYKTGLKNDPLIAGKFLLHCAVLITDAIEYANRLFLDIYEPDVFMYNTLIRGFSESNSPTRAFTTFVELCRNSKPDSYSFAFILKAAALSRCFRSGIQLHCLSMKYGLDLHLFVGTTLVSMYAECEGLEFARKMFGEMPERNVVAWNAMITGFFRCGDLEGAEEIFGLMPMRDLNSWNVMLAGYVKAGEVEIAEKFFLKIPDKDGVSWSTMIVGFAQNCCFDEAFGYFREMLRIGMRPSEVSLTGVLSACSQAGAFEFAKILHTFVEKSGLIWISSVNNALLDTYSRCGNVCMALLIFERMQGEKSVISWTSMIAGLAMQGYAEKATALFMEMEASGVRPDSITFISILYACSHAGLIEEGCCYFSEMKEKYGIKPAIEHYGCMVDLYGRAGQLHKAYDFILQMPIPPNPIIWRTLLGACSIHGNIDLAEKVRIRLFEMDPNNSSDHVLLSNIYAVAGKWKDVASVRKSMTSHKLNKTPGWSMIEVDKVMYSFSAGEKQNKITEGAYDKLEEIMLNLKVAGYIPESGGVLHDVEDEEKEDAVSKHSEKLAVAFGMTRSCKGRVLRIVKNLRVCTDCHTVMKLISKVYKLEIVLRDRSRFHSFKDGLCSCKDYW